MKTVILCGGKGIRLQEETAFKPKPMVEIGEQPILVHIMDLYSFYGHNEFILCLGYKGDVIREYFFNLSKFSDDFKIDLANGKTTCLRKYLGRNYKIIFAETGERTLTAERIKIASRYLKSDDYFMITYGDGVSNININKLISFHKNQEKKFATLATISAVHPSSKYGKISADKNEVIRQFSEKPILKDYINGGFMVFSKGALKYLKNGEMIEDSLVRMTEKGELSQFKHEGFWHSMDTMKDVIDLRELWTASRPWAVWEKANSGK